MRVAPDRDRFRARDDDVRRGGVDDRRARWIHPARVVGVVGELLVVDPHRLARDRVLPISVPVRFVAVATVAVRHGGTGGPHRRRGGFTHGAAVGRGAARESVGRRSDGGVQRGDVRHPVGCIRDRRRRGRRVGRPAVPARDAGRPLRAAVVGGRRDPGGSASRDGGRGGSARTRSDRRPVRGRLPSRGDRRAAGHRGRGAPNAPTRRDRGGGQPIGRVRVDRRHDHGDLRGHRRRHRCRGRSERTLRCLRGSCGDRRGGRGVPAGAPTRAAVRRPADLRRSRLAVRPGRDVHRTARRRVAFRGAASDDDADRGWNGRGQDPDLVTQWFGPRSRGIVAHRRRSRDSRSARRWRASDDGRSRVPGPAWRGPARRDHRGDAAAGADDPRDRAPVDRSVRPGGPRAA